MGKLLNGAAETAWWQGHSDRGGERMRKASLEPLKRFNPWFFTHRAEQGLAQISVDQRREVGWFLEVLEGQLSSDAAPQVAKKERKASMAFKRKPFCTRFQEDLQLHRQETPNILGGRVKIEKLMFASFCQFLEKISVEGSLHAGSVDRVSLDRISWQDLRLGARHVILPRRSFTLLE